MFDHEKLDVYRLSIDFVAWTFRQSRKLGAEHRNVRDQIIRASQSVPLNIAEGNGKLPSPDRKRFLRIALGSALECTAALDVLNACEGLDAETVADGKQYLGRIVAMLTRMTIDSSSVREGRGFEYEFEYE